MKAYNKWKTFVKCKKNEKVIEEQKQLKLADKKMLEKYFKIWKKFWVGKKIEKHKLMRQQMKEKKLADLVKSIVVKNKEFKLEKNEPEENPSKKEAYIAKPVKVKNVNEVFENRYKALLKIVAEQREKLVRQEEVIERLHKEQLLKETNKLVEKSNKEAEIAIKNYDPRLKTKAKVLKQSTEMVIGNTNNCHILVKSMTQRAEDIKRTKEQAKLRRAEIEEQKRLEEIEIEKKKKKEEELNKKKEKIEIEKRKELEAKQILELQLKRLQTQKMISEAVKHYEQKLKWKCFKALNQIIDESNKRSEQAHLHYINNITMRYFKKWATSVKDSIEKKMEIAKQYYDVSLLQKFWKVWVKHHEDCVRKKQVSIDLYEFKLQQKVFRRWCVYTSQQYLRSVKLMEEARKYHERELMIWAFNQWKQFTNLAHLYREQELRRQSWRHKVKEILPDFCPIITDELET